MVAPTENCTWIKDNLKVETNPTSEVFTYQGLVVDELAGFNYDGHNEACYTVRNPGGGDKGVNVYSIKDVRLAIAVCTTKYYENMGRLIDLNIIEWIWIKHFKSLIQIQDNWNNPESLPEFIRTVAVMNLLDIIRDHLRNKIGIRKISLLFVVPSIVVPDPIGYRITTLPYSKDTEVFHEYIISRALHNCPGYAEDNFMVLEVLLHFFQVSNHMIGVNPFVRKLNGLRDIHGNL